MTNAEILAHEIATRFFDVNHQRICTWIHEDLADNDNEPADFGHFSDQFKVNDDLSGMNLDDFINVQLDFLDLNNRDSITTKLWNCMNDLYDRLVDSILQEDTNTNDERTDYYASVI